MKFKMIACAGLSMILFALFGAVNVKAQKAQTLNFNTETRFKIDVGESKDFVFEAKQGDFLTVTTVEDAAVQLYFELYSPTGEDLLKKQDGLAEAIVLPIGGTYRLRTFVPKDAAEEGSVGPYAVGFTASNRFALPKGSQRVSTRSVNGYDINIYRSEEDFSTALEILKGGTRLVYLLGATSIPFQFMDEATEVDGLAGKRERAVWETPDKTGDGVPDVIVQFFSGGAHCCFDFYIFELGDKLIQRPTLSTGDASIAAMRVNPGGGVRIRTADMSFAYWNIHFAGSPAATVILDFKNGEWRPNFAAMKRRPPTATALKAKAAKARKLISNKPYRGDEFAGIEGDGYLFEEAFWGTMLDLIYTGNEKEAWKFFDDVWPKTKPGKEMFRKDFEAQLMASEFWRMILEDQGVKVEGSGSALDERGKKYAEGIEKIVERIKE